MGKISLLIFCFASLVGCSLIPGADIIDAVNPLKDDSGINTDVQLGKTNNLSRDKSLISLKSDSHDKNEITAKDFYQTNSAKDSPWLIVGFAIMTGFFFMQVFSWLKNRSSTKERQEVLYEFRKKLNSND